MVQNESLSELEISIASEALVLLSEKAIHMPEYDILIVSDLHFGKIEHFRKNGIGLPVNAARKDIEKLSQLIMRMSPKKVIFLGDLFHSDYNDAWISFVEMLGAFPDVIFHLVIGNHDILDAGMYADMEVTKELHINDLILTHEPMDTIVEGKYNLCGHIHPGVILKGRGKQSLRIPCFFFGMHTGILPSYGTFTGTHVLKPVVGDQIFVVKDDFVIKVT